ncbi:MAG: nucleotide exchange factor GrpE [Defluviitaleaceae bacterium]|nr:nucleotide exchange factor GrpE [Defluviitaleaceae bacterium]
MATRTRSKVKSKREIKEKKSSLWALWQDYKKVASENLSQSINKKFSALNGAVNVQIAADSARFSRLGDNDEAIYAHLVGLMGVYRRVNELAKSYTFESPEVGALIMGICEVLASRLKEFEDSGYTAGDANPITREKRGIIDEALKKASGVISEQKLRFATGLREDSSQEWDESFDAILRGDFYEMYSVYREGLKFCLRKLDDLHSREKAGFYTDLIEREWEELGNIIKVQVLALEEAEERELAADPQSAGAVASILDALREAYQQTGPVIEKLQNLMSAAVPKGRAAPCRSFDDFEAELIAALEASTPAMPERKIFFAALDAEAMVIFDGSGVEYKKAAYTLQRVISADILLAEEITRVFSGALEKMPRKAAGISDTVEAEIIKGISETIEIKISGLNESIQNFSKQHADTIKDFSAERDSLPEDERRAVLEAVRAEWLNSAPGEYGINTFFENCRLGEAFAPCRERVETQISQYLEMIEKSSYRFKKEVLLYEICTFEEILTHSVSRLRTSENAETLKLAAMLDDTFRSLEVILKKNNIAVIRPAVREMFNAKEHEVLVAEKQDGFEKGEIIKIVTAGYKHKEQIILRANVIAAR